MLTTHVNEFREIELSDDRLKANFANEDQWMPWEDFVAWRAQAREEARAGTLSAEDQRDITQGAAVFLGGPWSVKFNPPQDFPDDPESIHGGYAEILAPSERPGDISGYTVLRWGYDRGRIYVGVMVHPDEPFDLTAFGPFATIKEAIFCIRMSMMINAGSETPRMRSPCTVKAS